MKILKNMALLAIALVLSYFTADYFGGWYDKFSPLYDSSFAPISKDGLIFIAGFPFAYIFFTIILFQLFAGGNKKKWTIWLLVPAFLFFGSGDLKHIYLPILLAFSAIGLSTLIRPMISKSK